MTETTASVISTSSLPAVAAPLTFPFGKAQRLLTPADYTAVFKQATTRVSHPSFLILVRRNEQTHPRLGLVVAKKYVKRANQRNLIKRMARESFRLQQHHLPSIDAIVLARRGAGEFSSHELLAIFNGLWKRISRQAQQRAG